MPLGMWWNRINTVGDAVDTPFLEHGELAMHWLPLACQHCENPPCTKVCPVAATYTRDDGVVMQDNRALHRLPVLPGGLPVRGARVQLGDARTAHRVQHRHGGRAARRHHGEVHLLRA